MFHFIALIFDVTTSQLKIEEGSCSGNTYTEAAANLEHIYSDRIFSLDLRREKN